MDDLRVMMEEYLSDPSGRDHGGLAGSPSILRLELGLVNPRTGLLFVLIFFIILSYQNLIQSKRPYLCVVIKHTDKKHSPSPSLNGTL